MMSASCGTEIASMRAAVGEKIVGRQLECGRMAFQLYIYDYYCHNLFHDIRIFISCISHITTTNAALLVVNPRATP